MRIMIINPNTSESITEHLRRELEGLPPGDVELAFCNPEHGPVSIESAYEEALVVPPTLDLVRKAEDDGYDAVVLACFSDPGLEAARELVSIPVVGIEEASLHVAAQLGYRFTILTTFHRRVPTRTEHVSLRGLGERLASVRPLEMSVLEMDAQPERTRTRLLQVAAAAVDQDGAEVIVLGCAGLTGYASDLERELGVAVVDPTPVAVLTAEMLVRLGLRHSKRALYAAPPSKLIK